MDTNENRMLEEMEDQMCDFPFVSASFIKLYIKIILKNSHEFF